MRTGIILAIFASLVLVGGASWTRFSKEKSAANLIAVEQSAGSETRYQEAFANYLNSTSTARSASAEPLTNTDIISRQLITDYISLVGSGGNSDADLTDLVDNYVKSIPTLTVTFKVNYADLRLVDNSRANFETYAQKVGTIYAKYANDVERASAARKIVSTQTASDYEFFRKAGQAYEERAAELKSLAVPLKLASSHLALINSNLESASALEAISKAENDPMTAVAGLASMDNGLNGEMAALKEIEQIFNSDGI